MIDSKDQSGPPNYRARPLRILYGVSSVGLGHVRRSLLITEKLRQLNPGIELQIEWLAAEPALSFLKLREEKTLEVCSKLESMSTFLEKDAKNGSISDMAKITAETSEGAKRNYELIKPFLQNYDVLIQDEFVETLFSFMWDKFPPLPSKTVAITDYIKFETESANPIDKIKIGFANRMLKKAYTNQQLRIFLDTPDALPNSSSAREWIAQNFHVLGPVVEPPPSETKTQLREKIFGHVGAVKFVVFTVGGTSVGKSLVSFVIKNADFLSERLDAYLVILLGPRINAVDFKHVESTRLSLVPFTFDAVKYFKAAECVVSQAGSSTLYEVASLGVPCVVVPITNHYEQQQNADRFAGRFGFEILDYSDLSLVKLQRAIVNAVKSERYEPIKQTKASESAAKLIYNLAGV